MSVKYYGIFLAYPPTVDLRAEGLGRHLAAFLGAAAQRKDVRFVVACPNWSKESLLQLCESEGVDHGGFDIVTTAGRPFILRAFEAIQRYRARVRGKGVLSRLKGVVVGSMQEHRNWVERALAHSRRGWRFVPAAAYFGGLAVLTLPVGSAYAAFQGFRAAVGALQQRVARSPAVRMVFARGAAMLGNPENDAFVFRVYRLMEARETESLVDVVNRLEHVSAWYCPTAFWPGFNEIVAPRLMCVPDVVFTDFPVGFARLGGDRFLSTFESVEKAIRGCDNLVTYSEHMKWATLVDRYQSSFDRVHVVRHAANVLDHWVKVVGFPDDRETSRNYCQMLLLGALQRSTNPGYTNGISNVSLPFIFFASQIRPSKNVLNLLRAYNYLLKKRIIGHKLILTGDPSALPDVGTFVCENDLARDVIFLPRLSVKELAACYRLAELAVNPSLSEGGCPFTFTEALSVDTPVVMGRIPVTMEVLDHPSLDDVMFFDPYDWKDMADRIEWGIRNRQRLLEAQKSVYASLSLRTWRNVVDEYVAILDGIAAPAAEGEGALS